MLAAIIVTACFVLTVIIILADKMNRAIAALVFGLIAYFTIAIAEGNDFTILVEFITSPPSENFVNLRTLILIIGISLLIQICKESGMFQYLAFNIIKLSGASSAKLLAIMSLLAVVLAAVLNNVLTILIMIPLTIKITNVLGINPRPYILTQGIIVNLGATLFSISSIPNILIVTTVGISFTEFFLNVGIMSIVCAGISIAFFHFVYRNNLEKPHENLRILKEFNAMEFVHDKGLMLKSLAVFLGTMASFIIIPAEFLSPEFIAVIGSLVLIIISKQNAEKIIEKVDFELILYLVGIFILSGALDRVGVLNLLAGGLMYVTGGDVFVTIIVVLWFSAYLSSNLDNISITKILIPVVGSLSNGFNQMDVDLTYYSLAFGANWGDNLSPMGDNIIVMNIANKNKVPIKSKDLFRLGFISTNLQLFVMTIYFSLISQLIIGLLLLAAVAIAVPVIVVYKRKKDSAIARRRSKIGSTQPNKPDQS
jgi:Na+/H+ antiporter NhaD/arsenite permease-like protein